MPQHRPRRGSPRARRRRPAACLRTRAHRSSSPPPSRAAVILGGGAGTRLYPLTKSRAKPAVPIGGAYRLIDVPMSNCINSGLSKIYILTQFNSTSLNRHLARTYNFGAGGVRFGGEGFVEVLAATQTPTDKEWFQGTADAVRQYAWLFDDIKNRSVTDIVILSGDHLYRMDYMKFVDHHRATGADITIGCLPCDEARASDFGLMKINAEGRIVEFAEKPKGEALRAMQVDTTVLGLDASDAKARPYIASMGIYVFKKETMLELLRGDATMNDFGGEIIPQAAQHKRVQAYLFDGYWEDIGTIESFFEANLALTENVSDALEPLRRAACWGGGRDPAARRGPGARLHAWAPPPGTTTHLGLDLGALTAPALPPPPSAPRSPPSSSSTTPRAPSTPPPASSRPPRSSAPRSRTPSSRTAPTWRSAPWTAPSWACARAWSAARASRTPCSWAPTTTRATPSARSCWPRAGCPSASARARTCGAASSTRTRASARTAKSSTSAFWVARGCCCAALPGLLLLLLLGPSCRLVLTCSRCGCVRAQGGRAGGVPRGGRLLHQERHHRGAAEPHHRQRHRHLGS